MTEILEMVALALIPAFLLLDLTTRAEPYRATRLWRLKAVLVSTGAFLVATETALVLGRLFGDFHLFDGAKLGIAGGAVVGILVYELAHYWYHRTVHKVPALWRVTHQMHHSAESLDAFGAYYLHPLDAAMFTAISAIVLFPVLGLSPEAGAIVAVFLTFNALFQHANIKTPRWVGYVIQRPESHSLHHARDIHGYNYADLPLWDMVFGTFRNPESFEAKQGFYTGASDRVLEMLVFQDVSTPPERSSLPSTHGHAPNSGQAEVETGAVVV